MIGSAELEVLANAARSQPAQREWQLQFHPEQWVAWANITELLDATRRCQLYGDYRSVQQRLGQYIEYLDTAAEDASRRCKRLDTQLRRFPYRKELQGTITVTDLEREHQQADFDHSLYTRLSRQYRMIGDALAWQLYGFQALPIYALGLNQSPGPISSSKESGAQAEKEEIEKFWNEQGAFALRHDYTNNLRVGDLSVFSPSHPDTAKLVEVKVEGRKVKSKQKKIGQIVSELAGYDVYTRHDGELFVHRKLAYQSSDGTIKTNISLLKEAIIQSKKQSIGSVSNNYLVVTVADFLNPANRAIEDLQREWANKTEEFIPSDVWPIRCFDLLVGDSRSRIARPGFAVPYTVYPLPSDYVSAIVTGYIQIHYRLNTTAVTQAFRDAGFEAECLLEGSQPLQKGRISYFRVRRGAITLTIHALPVEQLLFDGLPLEEFVASVVAHCNAEEAKRDIIVPASVRKNVRRFHGMSTYTSMEAVWRMSQAYVLPALSQEEETHPE